jgi:hypothetical protein
LAKDDAIRFLRSICFDPPSVLTDDAIVVAACGGSMNAIYKNRMCNVVDDSGDVLTLDGNSVEPFDVSYDDSELVIDPTDSEVADVDNLGEWYGMNEEHTTQLRRMLRGHLSLTEWYAIRQGR